MDLENLLVRDDIKIVIEKDGSILEFLVALEFRHFCTRRSSSDTQKMGAKNLWYLLGCFKGRYTYN